MRNESWWQWLRQLPETQLAGHTAKKSRSNPSRRRRLLFEPLEERRVLALGADFYSTPEDTTFFIGPNDFPADYLLSNDPPGSGPIFSNTQPANGTLDLLNSTFGFFTYAPNPGFTGIDTFTYTACDGSVIGSCSLDTALVTITVTPSNHPPFVANPILDPQSTTVGTFWGTPLLGTFADEDEAYPYANLTYAATLLSDDGLSYLPLPGWITLQTIHPATGNFDPKLFGTPTVDDVGILNIVVIGTDSSGESASDTFILTVIAPTVAPVAGKDEFSTPRDVVFNDSVAGNDSDPDSGPLPLSWIIVSGPQHSSAFTFDNTSGSFVYQPAAGFTGPDSFTYRVFDGLAYSDDATVTITVLTPEQLLDIIYTDLQALEAIPGKVPGTIPPALTFKVLQAEKSLSKGNITPATNQLGAVMLQLEAQVRKAPDSAESLEPVIQMLAAVVLSIGATP